MSRIRIHRRQFVTGALAAFGLGACNAVPMPKMGEGPPHVGVKSAVRMGPAPIKGADAKFAFSEIKGAPATHVIAFSKAISAQATERKLNVVQPGDPSATYLVTGYLSAIGGAGQETVYWGFLLLLAGLPVYTFVVTRKAPITES